MATSDQTTAPVLDELLKEAALTGDWVLDSSRSTVSLKNKSLWGLVPVKGVFREVTGKGTVAPTGEVTGALIVTAASIDTKNARRDNHLRSADFFESEKHPYITFTVEAIRPSGQGVTVSGTLSVRARARPLTFDAAAAVRGDGEIWLEATVDINRADFGLTWNLLGSVAMHNAITVHAVFLNR